MKEGRYSLVQFQIALFNLKLKARKQNTCMILKQTRKSTCTLSFDFVRKVRLR